MADAFTASGDLPNGARLRSGGPSQHEGLRVRLSRVPGETPKGVLARPLVLPAVLRTFGWTEEFTHSDYETIAAGQFSQPGGGPAGARRLRSIDDIETLTMIWTPAWLIDEAEPEQVERELRLIGRSKRPIELLATPYLGGRRRKPLLRANITIRSLAVLLKEGEPDTTYFTIRPEEWRSASAGRRGEGRNSRLPTTEAIDENDTLFGLAEKHYHDASGWRDIAEENGLKNWGPDTPLVKHKRLRVGSKIKIPKRSKQRSNGNGTGGVRAPA